MRDKPMDPSLYEGARTGDVGILRAITDDDVLNNLLSQKTPKGNNIFHIAAEFKQLNFFTYLPAQSSLFWAANKKGDTPLHIGARVGFDEVVDFLIRHAKTLHIESGADEESGPVDGEPHKKLLRVTNSEKDTALHVAVRNGNSGAVVMLMEADPELCCSTDGVKESPLFLAACKGFPSICHYILNNSPTCPSFQGINGVTALHSAVTHKYNGAEGLVENMLSKKPEIIKEVDLLGWTPLHYAAFRGNLESTHVLMRYNSSVSYILDKSGMSALHVAAYAGHTEVMTELIRARPDTCDLINAKEQTVLHAAVLGGRSNVVEYILKTPKLAGLINEADSEGNTPLHLAAIHQNHEIVKILIFNQRVDTTAINKEFSMVSHNFLDKTTEVQEMISDNSSSGDSIGVALFHQQISREFRILDPPEKHIISSSASVHQRKKLQADSSEDWVLGTNVLVAVLVATVTFTGALTIPGGFGNDGTPVLRGNLYFKLFLVFDVCSFLLSSLVIFIDFLAAAGISDKVYSPAGLIQYSIGGMVGAFASATVAMLSKPQKEESNADAIAFVSVCLAIFLFLMYKIIHKVAVHALVR